MFPKSYIYLCRKHIQSDIEKWLIDKCNGITVLSNKVNTLKQCRETLATLFEILDSRVSTDVYSTRIKTFLDSLQTGEFTYGKDFRQYLLREWIKHQEHFAHAHVMSKKTYGKVTTNVVEGSHSSFKNFAHLVSNLHSFCVNYKLYCHKMYEQFKSSKFIHILCYKIYLLLTSYCHLYRPNT